MYLKCPNCGTPHTAFQVQDLVPSSNGNMIGAEFHCRKCLHKVKVIWSVIQIDAKKDEEWEQMLKDQEKEWEEEQKKELESAYCSYDDVGERGGDS